MFLIALMRKGWQTVGRQQIWWVELGTAFEKD
jgi:hypothetical protein